MQSRAGRLLQQYKELKWTLAYY
uniref:Uncharacterized protein n=1 Tax=Anguilla anguilla TaxID=7936 RepID=A0A0E9RF33_ANGAN